MKSTFNISAIAIALAFTISACGGNTQTVETSGETSIAETPVSPAATETTLTLEGNDQMQFDKTELRVPAGQTITLTLKHTGTMDKNVMGHNFVLLKPGTDLVAFGQKAASAVVEDYVPASESANVIAHTKLIGGGESVTIQFTVPEKGTYDYLCSFPGHYAIMKGKLIAE